MRGSDCTKKCMKRGREFPYLTWLLCHWLWLIRYPKLTKAQPAHYLTEKSGGKYELLQEVAPIFLVETSFFWVALVPLLQLSVRSVYWHWKYSDEFWNTDTVKRSEATFYILALNMVKISCWFLALKNPDIFANVLNVFVIHLASLPSKKEVSQSKMQQNTPTVWHWFF